MEVLNIDVTILSVSKHLATVRSLTSLLLESLLFDGQQREREGVTMMREEIWASAYK